MTMGPACRTVVLVLLVLLQGVFESSAQVKCYQCSSSKEGRNELSTDCKVVERCTQCLTRFYKKGNVELVDRDCVERCVPGMVPVNYAGVASSATGEESCCFTDLCNAHPSSAATVGTMRLALLVLITLVIGRLTTP